MPIESLLFDSSKRTILSVSKMVCEHPELFDEVLQVAFADTSKVSARAMRVICFCSAENPELIRPWLPVLLGKLENVKTEGMKMNILKIFTFQPYRLEEEQLGYLVELCFRYISNGLEKPAIKAYSLDILYKTARQEPGLIPELIASINTRLPEESCSFNSRGRKIVRQLLLE